MIVGSVKVENEDSKATRTAYTLTVMSRLSSLDISISRYLDSKNDSPGETERWRSSGKCRSPDDPSAPQERSAQSLSQHIPLKRYKIVP